MIFILNTKRNTLATFVILSGNLQQGNQFTLRYSPYAQSYNYYGFTLGVGTALFEILDTNTVGIDGSRSRRLLGIHKNTEGDLLRTGVKIYIELWTVLM